MRSPWRLPAKAAPAILTAWWFFVGWRYYRERDHAPRWSVWPSILPDLLQWRAEALAREAGLVASLLCLLFWSWGVGRRLLRAARVQDSDPAGAICLNVAAGLGATGLALLLLGLLRLWNAPVFLAALAAGTLAIAADLRRHPPSLPPFAAAVPRRPWEAACAAILLLFAAFNLLGAFMPEIFYDALTYHLALPDLYWRRGGVVPTPENLYSGLPLLMQMLYGLALRAGGDGTARLLHWSLGLLSCLALHRLCRRLSPPDGSRVDAILACLLFYAAPVVGVLSWKSGVELGWTFFQTMALYALVSRLTTHRDRRWTALAGVLTGIAMGVKYQAWPTLFVLTAALAGTAAAAEAGLFFGAAALTAAPWAVKNILLYGNPLYPFFHASGPQWRLLLADGGARDLVATLTSRAGLQDWLLHPWSLTFSSGDLDSTGPLLLLGLPFLFLFRYREPPLRFLWLSLLGLWGCWSLTSTLTRFFIPHTALASALLAAAFERGLSGRMKTAARAGLLFVLCANFFWLTAWFNIYAAEGPVLGVQTAGAYLSGAHPAYARPPYAALEYINASLPKDARILFIGEARSFYCERDRVSMTLFDAHVLRELVGRSRNAEELASRLRSEGLSHVLVNINELAGWQGTSGKYLAFDERDRQLYDEFEKKFLRPVFEHRPPAAPDFSAPWVVVYELRAGPA